MIDIVRINAKGKPLGFLNNDLSKVKKYVEYLVSWLKERVKRANANGLIYGLSGGIDSAVVGALAQRAFPNNSIGVVMPIESMASDLPHIAKLTKKLNLNVKTVNLKSTYEALKNALPEVEDYRSLSNIKPRIRMTTLYALAQENNYLVVGTDNAVEYYIGYFTKYGDGGVDILPIVKLLKSDIYSLAEYLNIPEEIINKNPSAGLWEGQTDEDELGISYTDLDGYIGQKNENNKKNTVAKIKYLHKISQHKRNKIYQPKSVEQFFENNS